MPRLRVSPQEERNRHRRAIIDEYLALRGEVRKDLYKHINGCYRTALRKYHNPEKLTIEEITRLQLSDEKILTIVKGK